MLCEVGEQYIEIFHDYFIIASEGKHRPIIEQRAVVLTPKQMLERLPIVLRQVKAGNTSKNLLNENR